MKFQKGGETKRQTERRADKERDRTIGIQKNKKTDKEIERSGDRLKTQQIKIMTIFKKTLTHFEKKMVVI